MAEPQLSVRSAMARTLAHREPAALFYARLRFDCETDIDLEAVIRESRQPHPGPQGFPNDEP